MVRRITATTAAKRLREVLNEVGHNGEVFQVERHGKLVAEIRPAERLTLAGLLQWLRANPPDADFARAVEAGRGELNTWPQEDSWERWSTRRHSPCRAIQPWPRRLGRRGNRCRGDHRI